VAVATTWQIRGSYFESCNCDPICPCRRIDGVSGGRSTHGICAGVLSWLIDEGESAGTNLAGLTVALALRYDDDEPGSPWTIALYVDERGDDRQRTALEEIFLGRRRGPHIVQLPWVRKSSEVVEVRPASIDLDVGVRSLRVGEVASIRVSRRADEGRRVSCGIPGYQRIGTEYYADELRVEDGPFSWELSGNCAFASDFEYSSE